MKTFKILGLLLDYPRVPLFEARGDIVTCLREEALLAKKSIGQIECFLNKQAQKDMLDVAVAYVDTFDRGRAHCLHLFEHVHGESRDRGQAMVDLSEAYRSKGLHIKNNELPDYLPLFMEYLSLCPLPEARDLLGEAIDIIATIGSRLEKQNSAYAPIFAAIEALSAVKVDSARVEKALTRMPQDPETWEEIDEDWREVEAFGGDPLTATDCANCSAFARAPAQAGHKKIERRIK